MTMSNSPRIIDNIQMRKILLWINGLTDRIYLPEGDLTYPRNSKEWLTQCTRKLGYVQIDPIQAVEKAHHQILFTRNPGYKKGWLVESLEHDRSLFENWTHDASILPVESFPYWKHYFKGFKNKEIHKGYERYFAPVTPSFLRKLLNHIHNHGELKPSDFKSEVIHWNDAYATRTSLAKLGAEYLWRIGELCVSRRQGQMKVYDLTERVIPYAHREKSVSRSDFITWCCRKALLQLGVARPLKIAQYTDAISKATASEWCERKKSEVEEVHIDLVDGSKSGSCYALRSFLSSIEEIPEPTSKLRLINPFDPLIRDRERLRKVFGFDYTIEIWVPKHKRKYGYYVLPILEGLRFTGRIDLKSDRKSKVLRVNGLWWEKGIRSGKSRMKQLDQELRRLSKFIGLERVEYLNA